MKNKFLGILCIVIAAVCWGVFPVFNRLLFAEGFSAAQATALRVFTAGIVYFIWGAFTGVFKGIKLSDLPFFFVYGMAAVFSTNLFYSLGIQYLSAAMASMLLYTAPAFVIIFSAIFFHDPITKLKLISMVLTFVGSFFVVKGYDTESLKLNLVGIIFALLSGISYSLLTVIGRVGLKKYTSVQNSFIPVIFVALAFLAICPPHTIGISGTKNIILALALGVIGTVIPYYMYIKGLSLGIDGGNASLLANIEPITATVCGVVFFDDSLVVPQIIGIFVTLFGAALPIFFEKSNKR